MTNSVVLDLKKIKSIGKRYYSDHYWPLRVAFDAYLHGEAKLMDANPEVRGAAKRIYDWLDSARRAQATTPEESGKAPPKRKRVNRKTAPPSARETPAG